MKKIFITIALVAHTLIAQGEVESYSTTVKLPENKMIWPLPEFSKFDDAIHITGKFEKSKRVFAVDQGNWTESTYLITYHVTNFHKTYPHDKITFIATYRWPTPDSGIMMKALAFHFRKGTTLKFALKKDEHVRHMDYFNILTYKDISDPVE